MVSLIKNWCRETYPYIKYYLCNASSYVIPPSQAIFVHLYIFLHILFYYHLLLFSLTGKHVKGNSIQIKVCDQAFPGLTFHKHEVKTQGHESLQVQPVTEKNIDSVLFWAFFSSLWESMSVTKRLQIVDPLPSVSQDNRQVSAWSVKGTPSLCRLSGPFSYRYLWLICNIFYCHGWLWGWIGFL